MWKLIENVECSCPGLVLPAIYVHLDKGYLNDGLTVKKTREAINQRSQWEKRHNKHWGLRKENRPYLSSLTFTNKTIIEMLEHFLKNTEMCLLPVMCILPFTYCCSATTEHYAIQETLSKFNFIIFYSFESFCKKKYF